MKKIILAISLCLVVVGCGRRAAQQQYSSRPTILVSIEPYAYFVERIAGNTVTVRSLVPSGANPHIFEPTPREVGQAAEAQLWVRIGEAFEAKIATVLKEQRPGLVSIDMCQGIEMLEESGHSCHGHAHEEGKDRHVWLSPKLARTQAEKIANALIELYPDQREVYLRRLAAFVEDLKILDQEVGQMLLPCRDQAILVSHPALGYFCKDYHLVQLSVECEGKDPLPQHITKILKHARAHSVRSVLTQAQYNNKGAELIAEELHLPTHLIDPYARDYLENLTSIARLIADGN
jgi:zinc transport system substrate-binding protein